MELFLEKYNISVYDNIQKNIKRQENKRYKFGNGEDLIIAKSDYTSCVFLQALA